METTSTVLTLRFGLDVRTEAEARLAWPIAERVQDLVIGPVLARVIDDMAPRDGHARLDKVIVDLGSATVEGLEGAARGRFEERLRRALSEALRDARERPSESANLVPASARRLDLFEHFVTRGTLPAWAPSASAFSFDALVRGLVDASPEALVATLRRLADEPGALERLALQLSEEALAALLRALDAEGASVILQYLGDLREAHRAEPVPPVGDAAFAQLLWVLVLDFELHDPGSQFNRRSFVRGVLRGIAESQSLRYADVLAALARGVAAAERARPLGSSLPAVIRELCAEMQEAPRAEATAALHGPHETATLEALGRALDGAPRGDDGPQASLEALVLRLCRAAPEELAREVRARAHDPRALERIARGLGEEALRALLRVLDPESAALIIAYLADLRDVHRARPMPKLEDDAFGRLLWRLVLGFVAREAGSQFNRRAFVRGLLRGAAEAEALPYRELVSALAEGLRETERRRPLASSLPAVLREILLEPGTGAADDPAPAAAAAAPELAAHHLANPRTREQWASRLPTSALVALCAARAPRTHRALLAAAEILAEAWRAASPPEPRPAADRAVFWGVVLEVLAEGGAPAMSIERLTAALLRRFVARASAATDDVGARRALVAGIVGRAERRARDAGMAEVAAAIAGEREARAGARDGRPGGGKGSRQETERGGAAPPLSPAKPTPGKKASGLRGKAAEDEGTALFVDNAGVVIVAPFLPRFFDAVGLLATDEKGGVRLRDRECLSRAVHLLDFVVFGTWGAPEPKLVLNKVLCGAPSGAPIGRGEEPSEEEKRTTEVLLHSVLAAWPMLSGTSIAGLRETFLQREGKLVRKEGAWTLKVQRKTVDVLVDQLPWSRSVVAPPWLDAPLLVTW